MVCNNTSTSKLVYDYISGFHRENADGSKTLENGAGLPCSETSTTMAIPTRSRARC